VDGQLRAVQSCDRSSGAWTVNYLHTRSESKLVSCPAYASLRFRSYLVSELSSTRRVLPALLHRPVRMTFCWHSHLKFARTVAS
jgi:hypothetical protein